MCRNIKTLANFEPPATVDEVHASALQYVRKLSGMNKPSKANEEIFNRAVAEITHLTRHLLEDLEIHSEPRTREEEQQKAAERGRKREEQMREKYGKPKARARTRSKTAAVKSKAKKTAKSR